jgi:hypothetical protein
MTTYSEFVKQLEQEKDEIVCECKNRETFKPKTLYMLPSGGFSASLYSLGIMKSLFVSGNLMTKDNEFNRDNMFIGSSGGSIVVFVVLTCLHLKLHKKEPKNWFKLYVENIFTKIKPHELIRLYATTQMRSLLVEQIANCFLDDLTYTIMDVMTTKMLNEEFIGQPGVDFLKDELTDYFRLNYIKVVNGNTPFMTDNNKDLTGMSIEEQFKTMFCSCCTLNGISYARFFQNHDAGTTLDNYINCLSTYIENPNIRNVLCFTLTAYDNFTYNQLSNKNAYFTYADRSSLEVNYFFIQMWQDKCKAAGKNFCLINPPNKFNPIFKFNNSLYNELQQRIYYEADFMYMLERFLGNYFLHNGPDMRKVVTLFGYYETLHILKEINTFNADMQIKFANVDIEFLKGLWLFEGEIVNNNVNRDAKDLFHLTREEITKAVSEMKYHEMNGKSMIELCFVNYCGCREKSAEFLTNYLTMMQGYNYSDVIKKYAEIYPLQTGRKKNIWVNPERYLDGEYKRVSKNVVNIYFPSFTEKLKNIIPFR